MSLSHWSEGGKKTKRTKTEGLDKKDEDGSDEEKSSSPRIFDTKEFTEQWKSIHDFWNSQVKNDVPSSSSATTATTIVESQSSTKVDASQDGGSLLSFLNLFTTDPSDGSRGQGGLKELRDAQQNIQEIQSSLLGLLTGRISSQETVEDLVAKARRSSEQGDVSDTVSLEQVLNILRTVGDEMGTTFDKHIGNRNLPSIHPTNLYYFLEEEDEIKNFSWRRRRHRFCQGIDVACVEELNSYARIAEIGYHDDMSSIRRDLLEKFGYEVIYCQMDSLPGQPSHFLAVKKGQSSWTSSSLDMLLCVRGTKTITDVITDLLADAVDYRGGKAHSGILRSGKFLAEKHMDTFQQFLKASGKKKINLTLVGHSLGAGTASIAGMELHSRKDFHVQVYGFGCPALLSEDLSKGTRDYITTVVYDNDCVPRMSLASMINAVTNIGEYNWIPRAKEDMKDLIDQIQIILPAGIITNNIKNRLLEILDNTLLSTIIIPEATPEQIAPVLFPRK